MYYFVVPIVHRSTFRSMYYTFSFWKCFLILFKRIKKYLQKRKSLTATAWMGLTIQNRLVRPHKRLHGCDSSSACKVRTKRPKKWNILTHAIWEPKTWAKPRGSYLTPTMKKLSGLYQNTAHNCSPQMHRRAATQAFLGPIRKTRHEVTIRKYRALLLPDNEGRLGLM